MSMRALIVEDEAPASAKLRRWLSAERDVDVVAAVEDGLSARRAIASLTPHVVFLDIRIPEVDGLSLARGLGDNAPLIVFVTAHDDHAVSAFDTGAVDYLLKPYDRERFARTLDRVRERLARRPGAERVKVPVGDGMKFLDASAITWIEAEDNYVRIHTQGCDYYLRRTMVALLQQLAGRFVRIHRSRAVNTAEVESARPLARGDIEITLRGNTTLRVSRRYRDAFRAQTEF
jgi:two-component system, LytTR family, response regulator